MAFDVKTWVDRISEYPARRTLNDGTTTTTVTVTRAEGVISQEGDAFNAANMNDLEARINDEFTRMNAITSVTIPATWSDSKPYTITVNVLGMTAESNPSYALDPAVTNESVAEAFGYIDTASTANGSITFKCLRDKPTVAIPVILRGV